MGKNCITGDGDRGSEAGVMEAEHPTSNIEHPTSNFRSSGDINVAQASRLSLQKHDAITSLNIHP